MPSHDVLVIGAGLAGQRAALAAAEEGVSVDSTSLTCDPGRSVSGTCSRLSRVARPRKRPLTSTTGNQSQR